MSTLEAKKVSFTTATNIDIIGEFWGDEANPVVILLHGGGQTRHSWGKTAINLTNAGWSVLALDARGHGESSWSPDGTYTIDNFVNDLKSVLSQLSQKPVIIGASMGGLTALVSIGEEKEKLCKGLALVDVAPKMEQKGVERIMQFMAGNSAGFDNLEQVQNAIQSFLPNRKTPKNLNRLKKNLRIGEDGRFYWHWDPNLLKSWQNNSADEEQHVARLINASKNLKVPTLIVKGGISDMISKNMMDEFIEIIPNVEVVEISDAGHDVAGDNNNAFSKAIIEFLGRF